MVFHGERPEKMGYAIEGVEEEGAGGGAAEVPIATLLATADAAKGAEVFKKCAACHTINQGGANGVGPNLYGDVGEAIAQGKAGFAFSDALKGVGGNWDFDKMNAWLTSPRKFADGTKMTFAGPRQRAGSRQRDPVSEPAGLEPAAARRAGGGRRAAAGGSRAGGKARRAATQRGRAAENAPRRDRRHRQHRHARHRRAVGRSGSRAQGRRRREVSVRDPPQPSSGRRLPRSGGRRAGAAGAASSRR